jgi:threonine/homoserine/homoserine lactone efflux protein
MAGAMVVLAALPSLSVITVTTRAATGGMAHGAAATLGIVAGDAIFILIAVLGLQALQAVPAPLWLGLRIVGAAYLIWLGWSLLRPVAPSDRTAPATASGPVRSSFVAGLLLTLADQKALLFYLAFLPAFLDLPKLTVLDVVAVLLVATVAVGGVKLLYAATAARAGQVLAPRLQRGAQRLAGVVVIGVACWLLFNP